MPGPADAGRLPGSRAESYRRIVGALIELVGLVVFLALVCLVGWGVWTAVRGGSSRLPSRLPSRDRTYLAQAIAGARWAPAHDEVGGATRVLLRRSYTGLDGRPEVLEERVLETFPATDPAWEARFTEAMSRARMRCTYLNNEESAG